MERDQRSRVDEFFPAKKRRHSLSDFLLHANSDIHAKQGAESPSPSKKSTLDKYLVTTQNGRSPLAAQNLKEYQILDANPSENSRTLERQDQNKYEQPCQPALFRLQRCSQEPFLSCSSKIKDKESLTSTAVKDHKGCFNQPLAEENSQKLDSTTSINESKKHKGDVAFVTENSKQKTELAQFANDFLSMCCSGISSTSTSITSSSNAQATSVAREATSVEGDNDAGKTEHLDVAAAPSKQLEATHGTHTEDDSKKISEDVGNKVEVLTNVKMQGVTTVSINVCNAMAISSNAKPPEAANAVVAFSVSTFESPKVTNQRGRFSLSGKKRKSVSTSRTRSATRQKRTPQWSAGNSIFSPGDEFWDEAISLADGMVSNNADDVSNINVTDSNRLVENTVIDITPGHVVSPAKLSDEKDMNGSMPRIEAGIPVNVHIEPMHNKSRLNAGSASTAPTDPLAPLLRNITHGRLCYDVQDGFKRSIAETSPLPVRRFNFSNSPDKVDAAMEVTTDDKSLCQPVESAHVCNSILDKSKMPGKETHSTVAEVSGRTSLEKAEKLTTEQQLTMLEKRSSLLDGDKAKANLREAGSLACQSSSIVTIEKPDSVSQDIKPTVPLPNPLTLETKFEFSDWLPGPLCSVYQKKGLKRLYPWQVDCLQLPGVLQGKNLVYCASTSAGKSLVAEILMLRKVLSTEKKALLVLPYVSICSEKAEHLESLLEPFSKKVSSFFGTRGGASLPKDTSIAVCTIEKANSLINKLLEEGRLPELAVVVIDELHMVGDKDRGYLLELMLTKLRYAAGEGKDKDPTEKSSENGGKGLGLQIIGMSATMPNAAAVSKWLEAALYETNFRPVPLDEYIKVANSIYNKDMEVVRTIRKSADLAGKDPDHVVELCHEVVQEGHSVLLFCSSRKACEMSAKHVAKFLPAHEIMLRNTTSGPESAAIALEELQKCPAGLDPVLAETLPKGVAYHHAGLTAEERETVESCYRSGIVRVLTATSTLAAGVNLPARRVIFRQPRIGKDFIDGTRYRQMAGRAGRAGIDTRGESILICKPEELKRMSSLLNEECQPLLSCLAEDKNGMTRAILEVVAGGIVQSAIDVERYVKCTLLNSTQSFQEVVKSAQDSLRWLCHRKFLEWDQNSEVYNNTPLGKAAFGSCLSPEESLIVFEDLAKAREAFVLASDLHLVYQVTPIYVELEPDWTLYYKKFVELSPMDQAVGNRVGVLEPFLMRMAHGAPIVENRGQFTGKSPRRRHAMLSPMIRKNGRSSPTRATVEQTLRVCRRFYVSLILARLIQEAPLMDVCESFKVARGMVQALQEISGRFASMVSTFCERLGWHDLEGLVSRFQSRVCFGVRAEIVELAEIPGVKASRARALYKAGLRTPQAVAEATVSELVKALFESSSWASQDDSKSALRHRIQFSMAKKILNGARKLVLERAEAARVAAFSALRALGVDVPPALSQPLADNSALLRKQLEGQDVLASADVVQIASKVNMEHDDRANLQILSENGKPQLSKNTSVASSCGDELEHGILHANSIKPCNELGEQILGCGNDVLSQGPVDVDHLIGGFDEFFTLWQDKTEFFFDLHFNLSGKETGSPLFDIRGIAICWVGSPIYYASLGELSTAKKTRDGDKTICTEAKDKWNNILKIFCAEGKLKVTWNWKNQVMAFKYPSISVGVQGQMGHLAAGKLELGSPTRQLVSLPGVSIIDGVIDLHIAAWLLWPDEESTHNFSLEQEVKKRLPGNIAAKASREGRWINQMGRVAHNGCCRRVAQIRALHSVIWKLITAEGLTQPLLQQEIPLVSLLAELEAFGVTVDMEGCKRARQQLELKIKELEGRAHELAGVLFSLSVPAEIASVLYTHLKLPVPAGGNKGKQHPSTDKHALDALKGKHPIIEVIKEHRTLSKVLNSTLGSILFKARPIIAGEGRPGASKTIVYRVKGHWLQTSTATGRLSMEEPNLQCVEHPLSFTIMQHSEKSPKGQSVVDCTINPRDFFMPSQEGWVLLSADYSQIEVRLMAHFSGDSSLIELLSRPTGDLFKIITARWIGVEETKVTGKQRELTKRLVYGILYGMGISALADQLECSVSEATEKYNRFKAAFPGVAKWLKAAVHSCREQGYITTLAGRRRYLDKIKFGSLSERAKAERQAVNSICQGSAADLIKIAMIKLSNLEDLKSIRPGLDQEGKSLSSPSLKQKFRLLLQIHDELVLEVDKTALQEVGAFLRMCMEGATSLQVPLRVKLKCGPKWGSLQPLEDI